MKNKKVYILHILQNDTDEGWIEGIFSTRAKAEEHFKEMVEERASDFEDREDCPWVSYKEGEDYIIEMDNIK